MARSASSFRPSGPHFKILSPVSRRISTDGEDAEGNRPELAETGEPRAVIPAKAETGQMTLAILRKLPIKRNVMPNE